MGEAENKSPKYKYLPITYLPYPVGYPVGIQYTAGILYTCRGPYRVYGYTR